MFSNARISVQPASTSRMGASLGSLKNAATGQAQATTIAAVARPRSRLMVKAVS